MDVAPFVKSLQWLNDFWLLELPDKQLEQHFWRDEHVLKTYTSWDAYIATNQLISNIIMMRTLYKALADLSVLKHTWHMHVIILSNLLTCGAHLTFIMRRRSTYMRHRHRIVISQRMLRMVSLLLSVYQSSQGLQSAMAKALNVEKAGTASAPTLGAAVLNLTRPLFVAPVIIMGHGSWAFQTKWWLPLQLLTYLLSVLGSARHQSCRMAADPSSALLLQSTCQAVSSWHHYFITSIQGPMSLLLTSGTSITNAAACGSMPMAAKTLGWYAQGCYGVLMPIAGFCTLEWRLKARWVQATLGKQLVYGPAGWPRSHVEPRTFASSVQGFVSWVLVTVAASGLLWLTLTWVVPLLPVLKCESCADQGTCQPVLCEGALCSSPGAWTAAVVNMQMLFVLVGHLAVTNLMGG